ncbi:MAG: polyprenyl synthetase family protein [Pseudomonadota bacterium]
MDKSLLECEQELQRTIAIAGGRGCPPQLASALEYAVFPAGARVRPQLCLAVAAAIGGDAASRGLAMAAATAIELLHCASLVHDDLPCFDDATHRRGKPTVHAAYGERIALLTGDALIVTAFQSLGRAVGTAGQPERMALVLALVARGVGAPEGIAAGQAWECEPRVDVSRYHRAKTGALFIAATAAGAAAAGVDPEPWEVLGASIGEAYQVADDIQDATADEATLGKPTGRDAALNRPNAVAELGLEGAVGRLRQLLEGGIDTIPECPGREKLQELVRLQSSRFMPHCAGRDAA